MNKLMVFMLSALMTLATTFTVCASAPSDHYDPTPMTGSGAWSYIKVTPVSGETSRTHYVFSNYQKGTPPYEGTVEQVKGLTYNKNKNTLTISNYNEEDVILDARNMGTGFTIVLKGKKNRLRSINVDNEGWDSGLKIKGSGFITIGNKTDHNHVPLNVSGKCSINAGKIKLIAEKVDVGSGLGLRYTLMVKDKTSRKPFSTKMNYSKKVEINRFEMESGGAIVSSKDTITFTKAKKK